MSCLVVAWLLISPQIHHVNSLNDTVKQKKIELATLDQQIRAYKNAQADLAKATRKQDISGAIVTKENLVEPVLDLEAAASKAGTLEILNLKELESNVPTKKDKNSDVLTRAVAGITEVDYDLNTVSDYVGFVKFLAYLEHLPHFTEIGKVVLTAESLTSTIQQQSVSVNTGKIDGNLQGVFFIKTPAK